MAYTLPKRFTSTLTSILVMLQAFSYATGVDIYEAHNGVRSINCGPATKPLYLMTYRSMYGDYFAASGTHLCHWDGTNSHTVTEISTDTDNIPKVLVQNPSSATELLLCDTSNDGDCRIYKASSLTVSATVDLSTYGRLGTTASVVVVSAEALFTQEYPRQVLYVAQEKEADSEDTVVLSSRDVTRTRIDSVKIDVVTDEFTYEDGFTETFKRQVDLYTFDIYRITYVDGFSLGNWTYFISVFNEGTQYKTHLTRIGHVDVSYEQVAEIELTCEDSSGVHYNVTRATYLQISESGNTLFILFGIKQGDNSDPHSSAVCAFSQRDIENKFSKVHTDCQNGEGYLWPWYHQSHGVQCYEHDINIGAGRDYSLSSGPLYVSTSEHLSSISTQIHNHKQVLLLGTLSGYVLKVLVGEDGPPVVYTRFVLDSDSMVTSPMMLTEDGSTLMTISGNKMFRIQVATCSIYTDCVSCVSVDDPLGCGWCNGQCTQQNECPNAGDVGAWLPNSCPPIIREVTPLSGPLEGGTLVTISGAHLGNWSAASNVSITIKNVTCQITESTHDRVICMTSMVANETSGPVSVTLLDPQLQPVSHSSYASFNYQSVAVSDIYPLIGPASGGTRLTVEGTGLNVGTARQITVAGLLCNAISDSLNKTVCLTLSLHASRRRRSMREGYVEFTIDGFSYVSEEKFVYKNDPTIADVSPRNAIASGGTRITVTGENLDSVKKPLISVGGLQQACECYGENCFQLLCSAPPLALDEGPLDPETPKVLQIYFVMDGVEDLNSFPSTHPSLSEINYYSNPNISQFPGHEMTLSLAAEEEFLEIKGSDLDWGASMDDYNVTIGGEVCPVTHVYSHKLYCRLDNAIHSSKNGVTKNVEVRVGFMPRVTVGYLNYALAVTSSGSKTQTGGIPMAAIIVVACGVCVLMIVTIATTCVQRRKQKLKARNAVRMGELTVRYTAGERNGPQQHRNNNYLNPRSEDDAGMEGGAGQAAANCLSPEHLKLLEASNIVIDRERLMVLEEVGKGHFGCVNRGLLRIEGQKEEIPVAIKTLKAATGAVTIGEIDSFMEEALRMTDFQHRHVLKLLGICLDDGGMPLVILPFMEHGDLLSYIRDENNSPSFKELITFGIDIAHGMDYLAGLKFVHRDLAARNCMLDSELRVLVADFGLSRDVYDTQYYSSSDKQAKLPIKWMAPESLEKNVYNVRTDVWSYGVTLWELMTRGILPYPGVDSWDITQYLACGRRMHKPENCPDLVYQIMLRCWETNPMHRPTFAEIAKNLQLFVDEETIDTAPIHYVNVPSSPSIDARQKSTLASQASARYVNEPHANAHLDYLLPVNRQLSTGAQPQVDEVFEQHGGAENLLPQRIESQYLTSADVDERQRLLSSGSRKDPIEHGYYPASR